MTGGFEPNLAVLALLFVQRFVYLPVIAVLALARLVAGGWVARIPALAALLLALAGSAVAFAPYLSMQGPFYGRAAQWMLAGGGMAPPLAASALLLGSSLMPGRRGRWIDALHLIVLAGLAGLWIATMF